MTDKNPYAELEAAQAKTDADDGEVDQ